LHVNTRSKRCTRFFFTTLLSVPSRLLKGFHFFRPPFISLSPSLSLSLSLSVCVCVSVCVRERVYVRMFANGWFLRFRLPSSSTHEIMKRETQKCRNKDMVSGRTEQVRGPAEAHAERNWEERRGTMEEETNTERQRILESSRSALPVHPCPALISPFLFFPPCLPSSCCHAT